MVIWFETISLAESQCEILSRLLCCVNKTFLQFYIRYQGQLKPFVVMVFSRGEGQNRPLLATWNSWLSTQQKSSVAPPLVFCQMLSSAMAVQVSIPNCQTHCSFLRELCNCSANVMGMKILSKHCNPKLKRHVGRMSTTVIGMSLVNTCRAGKTEAQWKTLVTYRAWILHASNQHESFLSYIIKKNSNYNS